MNAPRTGQTDMDRFLGMCRSPLKSAARRRLALGMGAVMLGSPFAPRVQAAEPVPPIRVGFISPNTGFLSSFGAPNVFVHGLLAPWMQPLGFSHALIDVVAAVVRQSQSATREGLRESLARVLVSTALQVVDNTRSPFIPVTAPLTV